MDEFKKEFLDKREYWTARAFCSDVVTVINGPENFRYETFPDYKKKPGRVKLKEKRTKLFFDGRDWIKSLPGVIVSDNCETDDVLATLQTRDPQGTVIISNDKDFGQLAGMHYHPYKEKLFKVTLEEAGYNFLLQTLTGDATDNIPGLAGIGPVKGGRVLNKGRTFEEKLKAVLDKYKSVHGDNSENMFNFNAILLWLQREENERFSIEVLKNYYL